MTNTAWGERGIYRELRHLVGTAWVHFVDEAREYLRRYLWATMGG